MGELSDDEKAELAVLETKYRGAAPPPTNDGLTELEREKGRIQERMTAKKTPLPDNVVPFGRPKEG